jgi:hypothetical protein
LLAGITGVKGKTNLRDGEFLSDLHGARMDGEPARDDAFLLRSVHIACIGGKDSRKE